MSTKLLRVAHDIPRESIERAQVVILSDRTWSLIAPAPYRVHALSREVPLPAVTCPLIDIRSVGLSTGQTDRMLEVVEKCIHTDEGVIDLKGLISGLKALGAVVLPEIERVASRVQ